MANSPPDSCGDHCVRGSSSVDREVVWRRRCLLGDACTLRRDSARRHPGRVDGGSPICAAVGEASRAGGARRDRLACLHTSVRQRTCVRRFPAGVRVTQRRADLRTSGSGRCSVPTLHKAVRRSGADQLRAVLVSLADLRRDAPERMAAHLSRWLPRSSGGHGRGHRDVVCRY